MPVLDLRLFGVPRLFLDGEEIVISRPRVFECLARIVLAGPDGLTRSELCRKIWPEFDPSDARAQLRGTLMKLRAELERAAIDNQFELGGETVRAIGVASCDVTSFIGKRVSDLGDIRMAVQPVAKSWEEANWREESDKVADALATAFDKVKAKDACGAVELLSKAVQSHPTSTRLVILLVRRLENLNRIDEANQAIIAFEDAWVDRFGNVDLPQLSLSSSNQQNGVKSPIKKPHRVAIFVGAACLASVSLLFLLLGNMRLPGEVNQPSPSDLKVVSNAQFTRFGKAYELIQLTSGDSRVEGLRRFSDGATSIRSCKSHAEREDIVETDGRITPSLAFPAIIVDRFQGSTLTSESPYSVRWSKGKDSFRLTGTNELKFCDAIRSLGSGRLLGVRVSNDPFRDHIQTLIADSKGITLVRPKGLDSQILVPTFFTPEKLFVTYSAGQQEGWNYHAGVYSLNTGQFTSLPYPHVAYESSKGTLVVLPQVTAIKNGDYDTHWDGRVLLIHPNRQPIEVLISRLNHFEFVACFADSLILQTSHNSAAKHFFVTSIDGDPPPFELPSQVSDLFVSEDCKALIYRTYQRRNESNSYTLIEVQ